MQNGEGQSGDQIECSQSCSLLLPQLPLIQLLHHWLFVFNAYLVQVHHFDFSHGTATAVVLSTQWHSFMVIFIQAYDKNHLLAVLLVFNFPSVLIHRSERLSLYKCVLIVLFCPPCCVVFPVSQTCWNRSVRNNWVELANLTQIPLIRLNEVGQNHLQGPHKQGYVESHSSLLTV